MNSRTKGYICGIVSAVCYGTNPLGANFLYAEGMNVPSVLFTRFALAALIIGVLMAVHRDSFRITLREAGLLTLLGVLFAMSSLSLFFSFQFMDAGIASTLLFVYPLMVAVIMALFFKQPLTWRMGTAIALALGGISLLYRGGDGAPLSVIGVTLVFVSSLTYAIYIVVVNRSGMKMPVLKMTFYVILTVVATVAIYGLTVPGEGLMAPPTPFAWGMSAMLAVVPSVMALILLTVAVKEIGSTPTSILGALEPLTAVVIGITVFGEAFTGRLAIGILLILAGVTYAVTPSRKSRRGDVKKAG